MSNVKYLPWPYGKLGSKERSELTELKEAGYDIDRKSISLGTELIKEIGTYKATIKLQKEVSVEISFEVVEE